MPYSSTEGKDWIAARIAKLNPASVLDLGPGSGTYARLLRPRLPDTTFYAVEIHAPYVERFGLDHLYDHLLIGDIREGAWCAPGDGPDVVILGDVLEHMHATDAHAVWCRARTSAQQAVFLSLPIVEYPQGECEGNPHEAHLETWSHDRVLAELDGITAHATYSEIGVYRAEPDRKASA